MVQTCTKCSRANPPDAVYCYYDGLVLGGHSRNGGPVAVGAQAFASPFVFPSGKACRSFNELALACQDDWKGARDLLQQGYLETFLGGLGRIDLVMAAKEASKFPDPDRGLDQFLSKLPTDVLDAPRLAIETQEINLGVLPAGSDGREIKLHLENKGMRLLYGSVSSSDGVWLSVGDGPGAAEKHFQFGHELVLPVRVVGDRLRAGNKPLEARLNIETNGGSATVTVRAEVPIRPFPSGVLAGATSPRKVAVEAKAHPKEAAVLFENGEVAAWYKSNGWTYPVQGPPASGLAAVQQFFEALGLTPAPKVQINVKAIQLAGSPGAPLRYAIEVKTEEKKPIYAHGTSNQSWLEVGRAKIAGRLVTVPLSVPAVPNKPGQSLVASVTVQSNGNQRFVVPVTLQVEGGGNASAFAFDEPEPVLAEEPEVLDVVEMVEDVAAAPTRPAPSPVAAVPSRPPSAPHIQVEAPPPISTSGAYSRYRRKSKPLWVHALPAGLLGLALLIVVIVDLVGRGGASASGGGTELPPPDVPPVAGTNPEDWTFTNLKDKTPKLDLRFNENNHRFGILLRDGHKQLTFDEMGGTNNTIIDIEDFEYYFGEEQGENRVVSSKDLPKSHGRYGNVTVMNFPKKEIRVKQHVEIVPGQSGYLDTCLVWYHVENYGKATTRVGVRFMLDTFIGSNDGVPFTAPGYKLILDQRDFKNVDIPPYLEVVENGDNPKDPGTVVRLGLKNIRLPGVDHMEDPDDVRITHFPPNEGRQRWDVPMKSIQEDKPDSCVAIYWPQSIDKSLVAAMAGGTARDIAFTYGLSNLEISTGAGGGNAALALSPVDTQQPDSDFTVTAYVYNAHQGDTVELKLPDGLKFAGGDAAQKTLDEGGQRVVVTWKVHAGKDGVYPIEATSRGAKTKPINVVVKRGSIFG